MSAARIYTAALRWARFARQQGARFDVEKKAADALAFSVDVSARRFAIPSKLIGTKQHAPRLVALAHLIRDDGPQLLQLVPSAPTSGEPQILARCLALRCGEGAGCTVGRIQQKHAPWLLPLVERRAVRCFALDVTGGTPERPTRGLNIAFSFAAPAPLAPHLVRDASARYAIRPAHAGDGTASAPPAPARSWAACPFCGGSGRVRYTEPHPDTGEPTDAEETCEMCDGIGYPPPCAEPRVVYGVPFPLGRLLATPGALAIAHTACLDLAALVARHQTGDWGDLGAEDRAANARALRTGARLLSRYDTPAGTLWVITEADRSATTVLRPDEY